MLLRLAQEPQLFLIVLVAFVVAITIHEASHALVATWLGDDLPRSQGRLTLNPLRHLDPLGTIMIAVASFGWGRPVLVNPHRMRFGVNRSMALVAAAGPASNVIFALLLTPLARDLFAGDPSALDFWTNAVWLVMRMNVVLAVFNLLPIPPLDGFNVLVGVVPSEMAARLNELRRYGPVALIVVFLLIAVVPQLSVIISVPADWVTYLLLGI